MTFSELKLAEPVLRAVEAQKYTHPSPIQKQAIPHLLAGRDVLGCAQTGTGKTAAFALPIVHTLHQSRGGGRGRRPRALVLTPTRELAAQVGACFTAFGAFSGIKTAIVFGGVGQGPQAAAMRNGVDVLVATPGRLKDLMQQKICDLRDISMLVLDEADHMLDLGFIHDVKAILAKVPQKRQTLLFSATMPGEIAALAASVLRDPVTVTVAPVSSAVETVTQSVYHVDKPNKINLLTQLLQTGEIASGLVFSRTKHGADKISRKLNSVGIRAGAIHGNKSQSARNDALNRFKKGELRILVATDIAARGIDIHSLPHVVNYDLPDVPETYVHRIGRTGRAGREGTAISFCDASEQSCLRGIESLISNRIPVVRKHDFTPSSSAPVSTPVETGRKGPSRPAASAAGQGRRRPGVPASGSRRGADAGAGSGARRNADGFPRRGGENNSRRSGENAAWLNADGSPRRGGENTPRRGGDSSLRRNADGARSRKGAGSRQSFNRKAS